MIHGDLAYKKMQLKARSQLVHSRCLGYTVISMTQRQRNKPKILSPDYLVGLTDGEGCFYVYPRPVHVSRGKQSSVELHFYIKLKGDNLSLLRKVKQTFGCGEIYHQVEKRVNHSECFRFEINSQKDIHNVLLPFFDRHQLQSPKIIDYKIFRQVAMMVKRKEHLTDKGLKKIRSLKTKINLGARRMWKIRLSGGNAK